MMLKVIRSDRPTAYYSPVENVQESIAELYEDPTSYGLTVTVVNEDNVSVEFDFSNRISKAGIRSKLLELQNLLW